jgi:hypothetical protein
MGIYPHRVLIPTSTGYLETIQTPGLIRRRELTGGDWIEERTNCFCCSCDPGGSNADPCCRNHGWWGLRPCEEHRMPGRPTEDRNMPVSVQEYRYRIEVKR